MTNETEQQNTCMQSCNPRPTCLKLKEVRQRLNDSPSFVEKFGGEISYPTLVNWAGKSYSGERIIFPSVHKFGKTWAIFESDLEGIEDRLPVQGNPEWAAGKPRREESTYRWGPVFRNQARELAKLWPYVPSGNETPRKYALRIVRGWLAGLDANDDMRTLYNKPEQYPRKQLVEHLTRLGKERLKQLAEQVAG